MIKRAPHIEAPAVPSKSGGGAVSISACCVPGLIPSGDRRRIPMASRSHCIALPAANLAVVLAFGDQALASGHRLRRRAHEESQRVGQRARQRSCHRRSVHRCRQAPDSAGAQDAQTARLVPTWRRPPPAAAAAESLPPPAASHGAEPRSARCSCALRTATVPPHTTPALAAAQDAPSLQQRAQVHL